MYRPTTVKYLFIYLLYSHAGSHVVRWRLSAELEDGLVDDGRDGRDDRSEQEPGRESLAERRQALVLGHVSQRLHNTRHAQRHAHKTRTQRA